MKCYQCHFESEQAAIFSTQTHFFAEETHLCPDCSYKKNLQKNRRSIWLFFILGVISIPLTFYPPLEVLGIILLNLATLQVLVLVSTVLHELGHALTGRLLGMRVFTVEIGYGRIIHEFFWAGIFWRIRVICFGGLAYVTPCEARLFRTKEFLMVLGGPLANALLLTLAIKCLMLDDSFQETPFSGFIPMVLLALGNVLLLFYSLWPHMVNSAAGKTSSDGLLLLQVWGFKKPQIEATLAARYLYEGNQCLQLKNLAGAEKWNRDGLKLYPDDFGLKYFAAHILSRKKQYSESVRACALMLAKYKNNATAASHLLNQLAYTYVMMNKPELLPKADVCSRLALAKDPWSAHNKGTRGCVLIELGNYQAGLQLLHEALEKHTENESIASDACHIAIAEARRGNQSISKNYFNMARIADPNCLLLERENKPLAALHG